MAKLFVNIGKLFGKPFVNSKQFAKLFDFFFGCADTRLTDPTRLGRQHVS